MNPFSPLVLGKAGIFRRVKLPHERRLHTYIIGGSGTGKSCLIYNLILQDFKNGRATGVVDLHGDLIPKILLAALSLLPWEEALRRIILLEPCRSPFGLNPLEVRDLSHPYAHVLSLQSSFKRCWRDFWGPRLADLLRNSFIVAMEGGLTLDQIPRLLTDGDFREEVIDDLKDKEAREYFQLRFNPLPKREKAIWIESFLNKLSEFIGDPTIRRCICQKSSTIDLKEIINREGALLLISLPKAILKENVNLFAGLILNTIETAIFERAKIPEKDRIPFYLFLDEFQNFVESSSTSFQTILSEARKYKLYLTLSHQNLSQIDQDLFESILANCSCFVIFRISRRDSEILAKELFLIDPKEMEMKKEKVGWLEESSEAPMSLVERWEERINLLTSLGHREAYVRIKGQGIFWMETEENRRFKVDDWDLEEKRERLLSLYSIKDRDEENEPEFKSKIIIEEAI